MSNKNKNSKANVGTMIKPITGKPAAHAAPIETAIVPAVQTVYIPPVPTEKQIAASYGHFTFSDSGVTDDGKATVDDVVNVGLDLFSQAQSAMEKISSVNRKTAMLLNWAESKGKVLMPDGKESSMLAVVEHRLREQFSTSAGFASAKGLMGSLKVIKANSLTIDPYSVKESLATLKAMGALAEDGITLVETEDAKPIIEAIKSGCGSAKLRKIRDDAKQAAKDKKKLKDATTNHGGKPADGEVAPVEPIAPVKEKHDANTPESIGRQLKSILGLMNTASLHAAELKVSMKDHQQALRDAGKAHVEAIALLMGMKGAFSIIGA